MKKKYLLQIVLFIISAMMFSSASAQNSSALDAYMTNQMKVYHVPGMAFSIIKDGKIVLSKGYGYANIEKDIPFTPNTINAEIASISKTVTSTAIMKLWEQGLFQLDDPINNYLPFDIKNPYFPNVPITFRMLLTHKATFNDDSILTVYNYNFNTQPNPSLENYLHDYLVPGGSQYNSAYFFNYAPGSQYAYGNTSFVILAYLVERISGIAFNEYCRQNIFQPLCMNHTGWFFHEVDTNIVSRPYYYDNGSSKQNDYGFYEGTEYPARLLKTTVTDLSKYMLMNMNYGILDGVRILDSATVAMIRTIGVTVYDGTDYKFAVGLGWDYIKQYGPNAIVNSIEEYWGKDGGDNGVATSMWNNTTDKTSVIIFANGESNFDFHVLFYLFDIASTISTSSIPNLNCSYISTPCEHSSTYWKNNSSQWALNSIPMKLGTKLTYSKNQILDLLNRSVNGDASITLAKALIAAKFNAAQGSELSPIILTINSAMNIIGLKRLPYDVPVSLSSSLGIQMLALAATLNSYNSGTLNAGACSGSSLRKTADVLEEGLPAHSISIYPNPLAGSTTISFALSQSGKISIKILDLNGRLVKTIADKEMNAGEQQVEWNAADVNAGIYFLQFQSADMLKTEKLIVTK